MGIVEGNAVLGKFMGWEKNTVNGLGDFVGKAFFLPEELNNYVPYFNDEFIIRNGFLKAEDLKFHSDWNWIMLVVQKISMLWCPDMTETFEGELLKVYDLHLVSDIKLVFNRCVNFAKYYGE